MSPDLQRCYTEQLECAEYLQSGKPDACGAMRGLEDWIAEECLIRLEATA